MLPALLVIIGIFGRMLEHPMNFTPVLAVALFSGAYLDKRYALVLPLAVMFITDVMIGFHETILVVWLCMAAVGAIGFWVREDVSIVRVIAGSVFGAVLFFIVTNFAAWFYLYEQTWAGLAQCYVAALPFFRNTFLSTVFYSLVLFGVYESARRLFKAKPYAGYWFSK